MSKVESGLEPVEFQAQAGQRDARLTFPRYSGVQSPSKSEARAYARAFRAERRKQRRAERRWLRDLGNE